MADNILLNAGSGGSILATDEIGGEHYEKILVGWGVDGTWTRVTAAAGFPVAPETGATWAITNDDAVDAGNSTTTPLGISAVFTGTGVNCLGYSTITITLKADQDSAVDGMVFEFSPDDTNWDDPNTFTYTASNARRFQFPVTAQYFRIRYTNGGTGQATFRVQTILHRQNSLTSMHRLVDDISPDRSATMVKAVIAAQSAGTGDYMVVQATAAGNFKVSIEEVNGAEMPVKGTVAHDAPGTADAPIKLGGVASTSEPAAVANADIVNAYLDATGHQHVKVDNTVTVDGSGVTQPVSGTVTANAGTNLNTSALATESGGNLAIIAGDTTSLDAKITACDTGAVVISSGTITTITNAVTVNSHAVTNAGTFAVQEDGAALTALELIDDTVAVLGTATYTETSTKGNVIGAVRNDDLAALAGTDNEIGPLQTNSLGALYTEPAQQIDYVFDGSAKVTVKRASGLAASGTTAMVAAVTDRKIRVLALQLIATSATVTNVYIANADNDLIGDATNPIPMAQDADGDNIAGFTMPWNPGGWFETDTVTEALNLILSVAQDVIYALTYVEVL